MTTTLVRLEEEQAHDDVPPLVHVIDERRDGLVALCGTSLSHVLEDFDPNDDPADCVVCLAMEAQWK